MISTIAQIAILCLVGGILVAVKSGFNQVIAGLQSIDEQLREKAQKRDERLS